MNEPETSNRPTPDEESLVEIVRFDYDATLRVLNGFVSTGNQVRAIGIAAASRSYKWRGAAGRRAIGVAICRSAPAPANAGGCRRG